MAGHLLQIVLQVLQLSLEVIIVQHRLQRSGEGKEGAGRLQTGNRRVGPPSWYQDRDDHLAPIGWIVGRPSLRS